MKRVQVILFWITDGQGEPITGSSTKDGLDLGEGSHAENAATKQLYILLSSEKALYVYSLIHAVQVMHDLLLVIIRTLADACDDTFSYVSGS